MPRRLAVIAVALGACGSQNTQLTRRAAVVGYAKPPVIAIVTRGTPELVGPWVASLRAASTVSVGAEVTRPPKSGPVQPEAAALCRAASDAAQGARLDEILVLSSRQDQAHTTKCIHEACDPHDWFGEKSHESQLAPRCVCDEWRYLGTTVTIKTDVQVLRASSCEVVSTETLPTSTGQADRGAGVEYKLETDARSAIGPDEVEAERIAAAAVATAARQVTWNYFPRELPIVRVEGRTVVIGQDPRQPLTSDSYLLKVPSRITLRPGIRRVSSDATTVTLETDASLGAIEPRDELHVNADVRRLSIYAAVDGGATSAQGETRGQAGASLAARWSFDRLPVVAEVRFKGDVLPGLDAARVGLGGAAGLRIPIEPLSPVIFGELGMARTSQGFEGAHAVGVYGGLGAGVEIWLSRWFLFADARRQWLRMDDWKDGNGDPATVAFPDLSWTSTTVQLGAGRRL